MPFPAFLNHLNICFHYLSKSEVARRAIAAYVGQATASAEFVSALDQAGDLVGCFEGGPKDLSHNPKHMSGFGKV